MPCISVVDPEMMKESEPTLSSDMLSQRKTRFKVDPLLLFVFDGAQELVPFQSVYGRIEGRVYNCTPTLPVQSVYSGIEGKTWDSIELKISNTVSIVRLGRSR